MFNPNKHSKNCFKRICKTPYIYQYPSYKTKKGLTHGYWDL